MNLEDFSKLYPAAPAGLRNLSAAMKKAQLDLTLTILIKIPASQMNSCAFCTQFHLSMARKLGVAQAKLDLIAVWRDARLFSAHEQASLAWTERLIALPTST